MAAPAPRERSFGSAPGGDLTLSAPDGAPNGPGALGPSGDGRPAQLRATDITGPGGIASWSLADLERAYASLEAIHDLTAELVAGPDPIPWRILRAGLGAPLASLYRELVARHAAAAARHATHPGPVHPDECPECELELLEAAADRWAASGTTWLGHFGAGGSLEAARDLAGALERGRRLVP